MATSKEAKQTVFNLLRLITSKLVSEIFEFYIFLSNKYSKQVCQILKNLYIDFRDTAFLHKFKVALNPL